MKDIKYILKKMIEIIKSLSYKSYYRIYSLFIHDSSCKVLWDVNDRNFGDILTPYILKNLTNKKITRINNPYNYPFEHYLVIGSILQRATKKSIIWGSGFIGEDSKCINIPKKIYAVRGPKTREKLLKDNIECPEVYGDPALLLPNIYSPNKEKKYKLGIVPHYVDKKNLWLTKFKNNKDVLIIDIQVDSPLNFVDELLSCEQIASSSLHGIIVADAYGIPSVWLEFSKNVKGNGFKFMDYFLSVGRVDKEPLVIEESTVLSEIYDSFYDYKINIDLDKLVDSCPFLNNLECKVMK